MPSNHERDWSTTIMTYSTVIFAIVSLITAYITITSWQTQRQADRPYFSIKGSPIIEIERNITFEFKFINVGKHPATNLVSNTFVFDQSLNVKPAHVDEYALINDIPREMTTQLDIQVDKQLVSPEEGKIHPQFIVIQLTYTDPVLKQTYQQAMYIKWAGLNNGHQQPLIHAETREKEKILNYLKQYHI
ncbi:hypothetical protein [Desulfitobacterium sp. AusDCA]|uniref:hypothetical protein n=1 Tax=Desulfitobacterium sp. AusDCA TaxID=3240383 RepID=UPI003DA79AFA